MYGRVHLLLLAVGQVFEASLRGGRGRNERRCLSGLATRAARNTQGKGGVLVSQPRQQWKREADALTAARAVETHTRERGGALAAKAAQNTHTRQRGGTALAAKAARKTPGEGGGASFFHLFEASLDEPV